MFPITAGATSQTIYVKLVDSSTFLAKTGLLYSDLTIYYTLSRALPASAVPATLAAANSAWATGGFKEVDATNEPGLYRFDVPNAAIAAPPYCILTFKASGMKDEAIVIFLPAYNPYDAVRLGLSALPNATPGTGSGLPIASDVLGIAAKTINLPSDPASAAAQATQFNAIPAAVLSAASSTPIKADVKRINGVVVNGTGVLGDEFKP